MTSWRSTNENASTGRRCPSRTLRPGWDGISLTGLGILDSRAVEVIGERVLISDGYDQRAPSDPMNHAIFVFDVTTDTTDPTVTVATPPAGAIYPRNQVVHADFSCADSAGGSGLASCVGTVADGQAIDTATVGPQTFTVTATDHAGNTAEVTRHYRVADGRPDARIRRGIGALVGNNVYNTTGFHETRSGAAGGGQSVTYYVSVQNDAPFAEQLRLKGQRSTTRFTVRYRNAANVNITSQVVAGTYRTPVLAPGATHTIRAVVRIHRRSPAGVVGPHRQRDLQHPPLHQGHGQVRDDPGLTPSPGRLRAVNQILTDGGGLRRSQC